MIFDLDEHVKKSLARLSATEYSAKGMYQSKDYGWQGDWEGRCLLALCGLSAILDEKLPELNKIMETLPEHLNKFGYLGNASDVSCVCEQQLSGHGWLLRGLSDYYELYKEERALNFAKRIVENLFLPVEKIFGQYPMIRKATKEGGVSGDSTEIIGNWELSTDVGCAFICMDGLSAYYKITKDEKVGEMLKRLIEKFLTIDLVALKTQTHATLTATRGILRYGESIGDKKYVDIALKLFETYRKYGMTDTYENFNWFGRPETWTEPCAIVDSLILATEFYKLTGKEEYKTLARRILFNGLTFAHRDNGGAGPNTCITKDRNVYKMAIYEAPFCCTMRYVDGLRCVNENKALFEGNAEEVRIDEKGRKMKGDVIIVKSKADGKEYLLTDLVFRTDSPEEFAVYY